MRNAKGVGTLMMVIALGTFTQLQCGELEKPVHQRRPLRKKPKALKNASDNKKANERREAEMENHKGKLIPLDCAGEVVHCKREKYDVYIGRGSKWGNPFKIGVNGSRREVIELYRDWILTQPHLIIALPELRGKVLGCWCKPLDCHGDVLFEMANS